MGIVGSGESRVSAPGFRASTLVNPVPHAMVLLGMVIAAGTTALALSMCVRIYEERGSLDRLWSKGPEGP